MNPDISCIWKLQSCGFIHQTSATPYTGVLVYTETLRYIYPNIKEKKAYTATPPVQIQPNAAQLIGPSFKVQSG